MYSKKPRWDTEISPPELVEFLEQHHPGKALDLGCGTGTNVITLAQYEWQATGVDFVPQAIQKAKKKSIIANVDVQFILSDVTNLQVDQPDYDLVLDIGCFHSLSEQRKKAYIMNLRHLLKNDAWFLLYGFIKHNNQNSTGITPDDLDLLNSNLTLVNKKDCRERNKFPSVWLTYRR